MKKLSIAILFLTLASQAAFAQRISTVSGVVTDDKTADKIIGAVLRLTSVADTTITKTAVSNAEGKVSISSVPFGEYTVRIHMMGYEEYARKVTVNARNISLGTLFMVQNAIQLDELTVKTQAIRTSQYGDTLTYNADAFKVPEGANVDELLKKLPGITVNDDGTVTAMGEQVNKILVDGKEFFGSDVTATMTNIPAGNTKKVKTYRKKSDFSEFTGINDGEDYRVLDLVTDIKFGQFGNFSAGYDFKDKYNVSADYSITNGTHFLTFNGSSNNTGAMNFGGNGGFGMALFSSGGGMGGGGMGGGGRRIMASFGGMGGGMGGFGGPSANVKSSTQSLGLNYNYNHSDNLSAFLTYRYGHSDSESKRHSDTEYLDERLPYNRSVSDSWNNSLNNQHSASGRVRWRFSERQYLNFRPEVRFRSSPGSSSSHTLYHSETDGIEDLFRDVANTQKNTSSQYDMSASLQHMVRFDKDGRSLTTELSGSLTKDDGDTSADNVRKEFNKPDSVLLSMTVNDSRGYRISARMSYTEPISEFWRLVASYNFSNSYSDRNSNSYRWDEDAGEYLPWNQNSNIMNTDNYTHRVGPGINFTRNRDAVNVSVNYQYTVLNGKRVLPAPDYNSRATFRNFVYDASFNKYFNPENSIDLRLNSSTSNPSISQLQDVDNVNNASYVRAGNSNLKPSDSYNSSLRYLRTSQTKGYTFMAFTSAGINKNNIGDSTVIVTDETWLTPNGTLLNRGDQYSKPVNKGSAWNASLGLSFGTPLNFMKCNLNVNANYSYSENDSYFNGRSTRVFNHGINSGVSLSTNFSTRFSTDASYSFNNNLSKYSEQERDDYTYVTHSISFNMRWITWKDFVLSTDLRYYKNKSNMDNYRFDNTMCNAYLGKKLFKNRRGEVTLGVHDLFNQNKQFSRVVGPYSIQNNTDNLIKRYFTLSFSYQFRNINGPSSFGRGHRGEMREGMREMWRQRGDVRSIPTIIGIGGGF